MFAKDIHATMMA